MDALATAKINAEDLEYLAEVEQEIAHSKNTEGGTKALSYEQIRNMTEEERTASRKSTAVAQNSQRSHVKNNLDSLSLGRHVTVEMEKQNVAAVNKLTGLTSCVSTNYQCYNLAKIIDKHDAERFLKTCDKKCNWSFLQVRLGVLDAAMTNFERMDVFKSSKKQVVDEEEQGGE